MLHNHSMYVKNRQKKMDNKSSIDIIYLDFQKAFDTLPHKRLITKFKGYGIQRDVIRCVDNF